MATSRPKPEETLGPMQFRVVGLLAAGMRNREIAGTLGGMSEQTVKTHISGALRKTGAESRVSLAVWFLSRFPTVEAKELGYSAACVYSAEQRARGARASAQRRKLGR